MIWLLLLLTTGCGASYFSASTSGSYRVVKPDGTTLDATYDSTKNQQGFVVESKADGSLRIHVDDSSTSERAIAAAQDFNRALLEAVTKAFEMGMAAGKAGS